MLPIGVVIPTRNSMAYLPRHLETVKAWLDLVAEVVVVDSCSDDGTVEYFREHLQHPKLQIISRPPGLYAAWNFGIQQLQSRYTYVSTVGDTMTRAGLENLYAAAEQCQADVVLSPPKLIDTEGVEMSTTEWPISRIIVQGQLKKPSLLSPVDALRWAVTSREHSILGSSASNLYRTAVLQKMPFPTDYFRAGDMAWGIMQARKLKFAVLPEIGSTFLFHPKEEGDSSGLWQKMSRLAQNTLEEALAQDESFRRRPELHRLLELMQLTQQGAERERELQQYRKQKMPWVLNSAAWKVRTERKRWKRQIDSLRRELKDHILIDLVPTG